MKKDKSKYPPLTPVHQLLCLGTRYTFGKGRTTNGSPLLYISAPNRPGLTVLAANLKAFQTALEEASAHFTAADLHGPGTMQAVSLPSIPTQNLCPGFLNKEWLESVRDGASASALEPHEFDQQPRSADGSLPKTCGVCSYDPEKHGLKLGKKSKRTK